MSKAGLVLRSPIITSQNQIDTQTSIELRSGFDLKIKKKIIKFSFLDI